jgi:DNA-binding CsgD family transcriptional regulator/tetratricopeptide (TPR) repeat protein
MLVGRGSEQAQINDLLARARAGGGGGLVLRGEPGIGKTALVRYAEERADGMRILRAQGVESEAELAFSGLFELVRPVLQFTDRLPPVQADALRSAFALGGGSGHDRFAVAAATLGVLAAAAEERPLLVTVDDAHWLDNASLEALVFAGRRLASDPVALIFAVREGEGRELPPKAFPELSLGGLDDESAAELLRSARRRPSEKVERELIRATAGNPLALLELPALLTDEELAGAARIASPLPTAATVEKAFARRASELPAETRRALVVVAALDAGDAAALHGALGSLGVAGAALAPAENARLVRIDGSIEFAHPLIRSALYQAASPGERRQAHAAIASALSPADVDRRAWHRALATDGVDEDVARALEDSAERAILRGGHAAAAAAWRRAAELTPASSEKSRRLLRAADAAQLAGAGKLGLELLEEALTLTEDAALRAEIQHARAWIAYYSGDPELAYELRSAETKRLEQIDEAGAAIAYAELTGLFLNSGDTEKALASGRRSFELAPKDGGRLEFIGNNALALALLGAGRAHDAAPYVRRCADIAEERRSDLADTRFMGMDTHFLVIAAQNLGEVEEHDRARTLFGSIISETRARGNVAGLTSALGSLGTLEYRAGRWHLARTLLAEVIDLDRDTHRKAWILCVRAETARIDALQGRSGACRAAVSEVQRDVGAERDFQTWAISRHALALLALGGGRVDDAIAELEPVAARMRAAQIGDVDYTALMPDLVEAYSRAGRQDDARELAACFATIAETSGLRWQLATAARCRGIVAAENAFDEPFKEALELHGDVPSIFEEGRTELAYGERLRRARRRVEARGHVRRALALFEQVQAVPWIERTRAELRASGETIRRPDPVTRDELTPQELRVATLVAEGMSNRDIAAALFLSPKTVEAHLGRAYRKLGTRSRAELVRLFATASDATIEQLVTPAARA